MASPARLGVDWKRGLPSPLSLRGRGNRIENTLAGRPSQEQHPGRPPALQPVACLSVCFLLFSLCSSLSSSLPFISLFSFHLIFLLCLHSSLCFCCSFSVFAFVCLPHIRSLSPYFSSWKQSFAKNILGLILSPCLHSSKPSIHPFLLWSWALPRPHPSWGLPPAAGSRPSPTLLPT